MTHYEKLLHKINRGRQGLNKGISIGMPRLNYAIGGLQKQRYILIGGFTGSAKSSFVDTAFILNPYDWWYANKNETDIKFEGTLWNMEREFSLRLAKWVGIKIYKLTGDIYESNFILGIGEQKNHVSDELYEMIRAFKDYYEEMTDYIEIKEGSINPTGIHKHNRNYFKDKGILLRADDTNIYANDELVDSFEKDIFEVSRRGDKKLFKIYMYGDKEYRIHPYQKIYIPYNENLIYFSLADHIGKLTKEQGFNAKQTIDKHSEYCGEDRDLFGMTAIDISQFNREVSDPRRLADPKLSPILEDFKETGNTQENADLVLGLFNPYRYKRFDHLEYDIKKFKLSSGENRFRSMFVLKNSFGIDDVAIGLKFIGECGYLAELPKATNMTDKDYLEALT